jgi:hypothetical protein
MLDIQQLTIETGRLELEDVLADIDGVKVNSDNVSGCLGSHGQTGRDSVDGVNLRGSLEERPPDRALL